VVVNTSIAGSVIVKHGGGEVGKANALNMHAARGVELYMLYISEKDESDGFEKHSANDDK